ncbi:MAG: four helix bundle suffix domain-containing protein [Prevotella sp.]
MEQNNKNISLRRFEDGTPSVMRKPTVYTELHFYRKSDVLVQLTKAFCNRFLPQYGDRTVDQMVQAARSIKQNIAEGLTDGQTSFEVEMKLLGIAKGSNQELLEDYLDYIKQRGIPEWAKENIERYDTMRRFCREHSDERDYHPFFTRWTDEEMANLAICLCHMVDKAMTSFLAKRDREFVEEGGIRERMTAARLDMRGTQKQIIAQQEKEIAQLKATIAAQQREITALKARLAESKENAGHEDAPG